MRGWTCRTSALAVAMLFTSCIAAAAQDYTEREKLRAESNEFRKEVIRVTDGVYVAVGQGMKQGERPGELVQHVTLPPPLAENPYLQEFYGGVAWTVRGIYADRVGWFDGNATNLFPLPEKDRAAKLVGLIGGPEQVLARGREALAASEFTWAAKLADYVLTPARHRGRLDILQMAEPAYVECLDVLRRPTCSKAHSTC